MTNNIADHGDEIQRWYLQECLSDAEVASRLNEKYGTSFTQSGIFHFRAREGIKGHRRGRKGVLSGQDDKIIEMYRSGMTDEQIGQEFGFSAESIRRVRIRNNVSRDRHKSSGRFSKTTKLNNIESQLPEMWERSKRWHSRQHRMVGSAVRVAQEASAVLGEQISPSVMSKKLKQMGIVETRSVHPQGWREEAVRLFDAGNSVPKVARTLGIPADTVRSEISAKRDLSPHPTSRMSHEEKLSWRRAISGSKATSVVGTGRYSYKGHRYDSSYEVRFAVNCDRLGLTWRPYDRAADGVCEVEVKGEIARYAPDFIVSSLPVEVKGIFDALAADKVRTWRERRGKLAMIMKQELLDFESARNQEDALATLQAACYLDPPTDPAYWD